MTDKHLSAMERAERLQSSLFNGPKMNYVDEIRLIAAEIKSAVEEAESKLGAIWAKKYDRSLSDCIDETYEDAAKIAEFHSGPSVQCAEKIRARAKEIK